MFFLQSPPPLPMGLSAMTVKCHFVICVISQDFTPTLTWSRTTAYCIPNVYKRLLRTPGATRSPSQSLQILHATIKLPECDLEDRHLQLKGRPGRYFFAKRPEYVYLAGSHIMLLFTVVTSPNVVVLREGLNQFSNTRVRAIDSASSLGSNHYHAVLRPNAFGNTSPKWLA